MKRIILHGEMANLFAPEVNISANTFNDILNGISANYPSFRSYFVRKILKGVDYVFVDSSNKEVSQQYIHLEAKDNIYHLHPRPVGAAGIGDSKAGAFGLQSVFGFAQSFGMSWLMNKINDAMDQDDDEENEIITTKSHIYSDNENRVEQGGPVPVIYGQLRVGSKIISSSIHNYDYDYDNAFIYPAKSHTTRLSQLMKGADYNFIEPKEIKDYRDTTNEPFLPWQTAGGTDLSKRIAAKVNPRSQAKETNAAQDNEPSNGNYSSSAGGEMRVEGPSIGSPNHPGSSATKQASNSTNARPFLYPIPGQLDYNCRPEGSSSFCVENDKAESLAWINKGSAMKVGSRTNFQKLESIGIYKSLEVISEGPIEGLANPITGVLDNGEINYPNVSRPTLSLPVENRAQIGALKYDKNLGGLVDDNNSTRTCTLIEAGDNYYPASQTISVTGDGTRYQGTGLSIKTDPPSNLMAASCEDISFEYERTTKVINNTVMAEPVGHVSSSKLFVLRTGDGSIHPNTNSNQIEGTNDYRLPVKYLPSESVGLMNPTGVYSLASLETDSAILNNQNFSVGAGYGVITKSISVSPDNKKANFDVSLKKLTSFDRKSTSTVLDCMHDSVRLIDNLGTPIFGELYIKHRDRVKPLKSTGWDKVARMYLDSSTASTISSNTGVVREFTVGSYTSGFGFGRRTYYIKVRVTLDAYINLGNATWVITGGVHNNFKFNYSSLIRVGKVNTLVNAFAHYGRNNAPAPLGELMRNASFANTLWNSFKSFFGNCPGAKSTVRFNHNGGTFAKYCPGSGSAVRNNALMPQSTFCLGGFNNLDNALILNDGTNPDEPQSAGSRGFYYPGSWPRVTVFVLRKYKFGVSSIENYSVFPTNIDCVAEVSKYGKIKKLHLLFVPDEPVYDSFINNGTFTPIFPQHISRPKPIVFSNPNDPTASSYEYQDLGFLLRIDDSNTETSQSFVINEDGQIQDIPPYNGNLRRSLITIERSWHDHIKFNNPNESFSNAAGFFNSSSSYPNNNSTPFFASQQFELNSVPNDVAPPSSPGIIDVSIETLELSSNHPVFNKPYRSSSLSSDWQAGQKNISTGRPFNITLKQKGGGYNRKGSGLGAGGSKITQSLFNTAYGVDTISVNSEGGGNKGYKPNSFFIFYGFSKYAVARNPLNKWRANTFKGMAETDRDGAIRQIKILDRGYGFSPTLSPNDFPVELTSLIDEGAALANGMIHNVDLGRHKLPEVNFSKQDLILEAKVNGGVKHLINGSVDKFYIKQVGSGFIYNQFITNPLSEVSYEAPVFNVTIGADNKILNVEVISTKMGVGYSSIDSNISAIFSKGGSSSIQQGNNVSNDKFAWARSIYLNDVPIRDRNDRFNYSKFDFDMRVGHVKNGYGESHLDLNSIRPIDSILIKKEFVLPSYTIVNDYPLFGPRNDGEKDYYYTHTIKNPNITNISLSIKIKKLHYIYEGDEATLYMNLIPILLATMGYMIGTSIVKGILARLAVPDPVIGVAKSFGFAGPCGGIVRSVGFVTAIEQPAEPSGFAEMAAGLLEAALIFGGGVLGALLGLLAASLFSCKKIPWLCFKVGEIIKNSGEIWPAKMHIAVEYGVEGENLTKETFAFRGCATSDYVKDIMIENLPSAGGYKNNFKNRIVKVYRLTREMDPVTGGIIEQRYQIQAELAGVTEYVEGFFSYPNTAIIGTRLNSKDHPSVPKREYLIKGRKINIPSNYNPENGAYAGNWNGSFRRGVDVKWTSNPAWIIYDLLINERYGVGKYGLKEKDIDHWSFYTFAKRCDETVDVIIDGKITTERRHMCNLYIDTSNEAYSYINRLMNMYNCSINFSSGKIYITQDAPKDAVMIFTNTNISEEGFSYSVIPKTNRITACSVDFVDERDNYMKKTEYVEDPEGVTKYGYSHVKITGVGITRRGEAHRLGWHKILSRQIENEIISFKAGIESSYLRIGDVIQVVDNNKIASQSGGRVSNIINATKIELDIPASYLNNVNAIFIENPTQSDDDEDTSDSSGISGRRSKQYLEYTINSRNGFEVGLSSSLDPSIKAGANWIIKENTAEKIKPKEYKIESLKEVSELNFEITALEYIREKFDDIDASTSSKDGINLDEREYYGHDIVVA
jgi:predicted phage tail protein